jgi:hypothetical protein
MHSRRSIPSYRDLESLCRSQARLSSTPQTRKILEKMAFEYQVLAECQENDEFEAGKSASV